MVKVQLQGSENWLGDTDHDWIQRIASCAAERLGDALAADSAEATVAVVLVNENEIADLHRRFFDDQSATDVITFPSGEQWFDGDQHLGDIVICGSVAADQARAAGHSRTREVAYLAIHGLLHLAGFDDQNEEARQSMLRKQSQLLEECERNCGLEPAWRP